MVFQLDAGPIVASESLNIEPCDTTPSLRGKLIPIGANLLANLLDQLANGNNSAFDHAAPQDESLATKFGKTKKEDGLVDPYQDDPEILWRKYRAYKPWPGIYFLQDGKRIKITQAKFENDTFIIQKVIPEGKSEIEWNR